MYIVPPYQLLLVVGLDLGARESMSVLCFPAYYGAYLSHLQSQGSWVTFLFIFPKEMPSYWLFSYVWSTVLPMRFVISFSSVISHEPSVGRDRLPWWVTWCQCNLQEGLKESSDSKTSSPTPKLGNSYLYLRDKRDNFARTRSLRVWTAATLSASSEPGVCEKPHLKGILSTFCSSGDADPVHQWNSVISRYQPRSPGTQATGILVD